MSITPLPPADFTPTMGNYNTPGTFRFWCQKVLPLVYDDSLSYYELLCKVVDYLNKTMEDVNTAVEDVTALHDAYDELQTYVNTYFSSLDVSEEINNKLDEMAADGSLTALISPLLPSLIAAWLQENLTPTTPPIDKTLTIENAAADAKTTGSELALRYKYNATGDLTDLDDFRSIGVYRLPSNAQYANLPSNYGGGGGCILVLNAYSSISANPPFTQLIQILLDEYNHKIWMRRNASGVNGAWKTWSDLDEWGIGSLYISPFDKHILNYENIKLNPVFVAGSNINSSGAVVSNANRCATEEYMDVSSGKRLYYSVPSGFRLYGAFYSDKTASAGFVSNFGWVTGDSSVAIPSTAKYLRVGFATSDDSVPATPTDAENLTLTYNYQLKTEIEEQKAIWQNNTYKYNDYRTGESEESYDLNDFKTIGVYPISATNVEYLNTPADYNNEGGTLIVCNAYARISQLPPYTQLYQILLAESTSKIWIRRCGTSYDWREWHPITERAYTQNSPKIDLNDCKDLGVYNLYSATAHTNTPPDYDGTGGSLIVINAYNGTSATVPPYTQLIQILIAEVQHKIWVRRCTTSFVWRDWTCVNTWVSPGNIQKTQWLAVGDSITYGVYSKNEGGTISTDVTITKNWVKLLADALSYDSQIMASRGMGYTVTGQDPENSSGPRITIDQLLTRIEALTTPFNLVTVAFGINDYATASSTIADITTAIQSTVQRICTKFKEARVVFITPLNSCREGTAQSNYAYNTQHGDKTLKDIADAIKNACTAVGVECIDATNGFLLNNYNIQQLLPDNTHPSLNGHALIAKNISHLLYY